MAKTANDHIEIAQTAFEAGFASKAAQARALGELNYAYNKMRDTAHHAQIAHANGNPALNNNGENRTEFFRLNDMPFDLHNVRDRHLVVFARWIDAEAASLISNLIALRAAIKSASIAPAPVKPEAVVKAETIRRSIVEEMERRKSLFVEGLDIGRMFADLYPRKNKAGEIVPSASLPVSVNAHWVSGHKGTDFVRHFFYFNGKLTPLQTIMAIASTLDSEIAE